VKLHFLRPVNMDKSAYTYQRLYASLSTRESGYHRFYVRLHHDLHPTDLHILITAYFAGSFIPLIYTSPIVYNIYN